MCCIHIATSAAVWCELVSRTCHQVIVVRAMGRVAAAVLVIFKVACGLRLGSEVGSLLAKPALAALEAAKGCMGMPTG